MQILNEIMNSENENDVRMLVVDDRLAIVSDIGRRKKKNQDYGKVGYREDGTAILIVADGVSNSQMADLAAKTAVNTIFSTLCHNNEFSKNVMQKSIEYAHEEVCKLPYDPSHRLDEPETTVVVAMIKNKTLIVGWVGDSRAYSINGTKPKLLTEDDSWCNMALEKGLITPEQMIGHPKSHIITQCLGVRNIKSLNVHTRQYGIGMGNGIVLCTDGLWDMVDMNEPMNINMTADMLSWMYTTKANRMGGLDNITIATWLP